MILRFRSIYGKLFIIIFTVICVLIYLNIEPQENGNSQETHTGTAKLRAHPRQRLVSIDNKKNELLDTNENAVQFPPLTDTENLPYELSVRLDIEKQEPGLGDGGKAVHLHGAAKERGDAIYKKLALNEELSERLSYNRTLSDTRNPECKNVHYDLDNLPTASVIIIFYNEPYSVLVRTIHSTINTCAGDKLHEIILVDDGSDHIELAGKLDYYIKTRLPKGKVHMLRLKERMGLIRARLAGARQATGDVLIFLDAHCEGNIGWCEPLLQRIKDSRTSVLVPIIDVIDSKDFQYSTNGYNSFQVGGFQWSGHFDWINVSENEKQRQRRECKEAREVCPTRSPTMAGGLFAIDRAYFWEVGSYDEQMDGWGGENLEMSFRIWQCGGTIETIPCSRVGHVFRDFHPYKFPKNRDTHGINTARMALVWMDDYADIFFLNRPDLKANPDIGDLTHRHILRKKLHCKNFDWYLKNIYPEKFVPTQKVIAYGRVKAVNGQLCLDDLLQNNEQPYNLGLYFCSKVLTKSQFFSYTNTQVLRNELSCATVQESDSPPHYVSMVTCLENDQFNEQWLYRNEQLIHANTRLCLDHRGLQSSSEIQVAVCDKDSDTQRWVIEHDD